MPKTKSEGIMPSRKAQIEADLKKNPDDPRYSFFTPKKSKSAVWQNFNVVKFNELIESYAQCNECKDILAYSAKSGTGSLLRHKCSKRTNYNQNEYKIQIKKCNMSTESADDNEQMESEAEDSILNEHNLENLTNENMKETTIEMASVSSGSTYSNVDRNSAHENDSPDYLTCNLANVKPAIIKDKYDVFGENVASELRELEDVQDIQYHLKVNILKSILEANNSAHEIRKTQKNQTN